MSLEFYSGCSFFILADQLVQPRAHRFRSFFTAACCDPTGKSLNALQKYPTFQEYFDRDYNREQVMISLNRNKHLRYTINMISGITGTAMIPDLSHIPTPPVVLDESEFPLYLEERTYIPYWGQESDETLWLPLDLYVSRFLHFAECHPFDKYEVYRAAKAFIPSLRKCIERYGNRTDQAWLITDLLMSNGLTNTQRCEIREMLK